MKRVLFLLLYCLYLNIIAYGQNKVLPNVIPVSPEAASIGKYGDIPIGYQSGIPSISIPLFQTSQGNIAIPITLSYHAGGTKVEEIASRVGLGWTLNVGGTISRTQRGLEDESFDGYFKTVDKANRYFNGSMVNPVEKKEYLKSLYCGRTDGEADIYHFNFGSFSGKFFYSSDSTFQTIPKSNLKITHKVGNFDWLITADDGNKYYFELPERSFVEPFCNGNNNAQITSTNVWHLTKIIDVYGDSVVFKYSSQYTETQTHGTDEFKTWVGGNLNFCENSRTYCVNHVKTFSYQLAEISSSSCKILFKSSPQVREDLYGGKALESIEVINVRNDTIKKIIFSQSYFDGQYSEKRLRLDSLQEVCRDKFNPPYIFAYNIDRALPNRLSYSQDYWGYYNGAVNNTLVQYQLTPTGPFIGANRKPNSLFTQVGIIKSLQYPTGGKVEFDFENNLYAKKIRPGFDYENLSSFYSFSGSNSSPLPNPATSSHVIVIGPNDIIPTLGFAAFKIDLQFTCSDLTVINQFTFSILGSNGYTRNNIFGGDTINLPLGTYYLNTAIETEFQNNPVCSFNIDILTIPYEPRDVKNEVGGGLRVKEIRKFDGLTNIPLIERFNYNLPNDTISSGCLSGNLPFQMPYVRREGRSDPGNCDFLVYSAATTYPLLETSGKPISYGYVTHTSVGAGETNGSKSMKFNTYQDEPDIVYSGWPYIPGEDKSLRRGLLLKEVINKSNNGGVYQPISETKKGYVFFGESEFNPAISVAKNIRFSSDHTWVGSFFHCDNEFDYLYQNPMMYTVSAYRTFTEPHSLRSDTIIKYEALGHLQQVVRYDFNLKNFLNSSDSSENSKGEDVISIIKFPKDFQPNSNQGNFLTSLVNSNLVKAPIETLKIIKKSGIPYVVSGEFLSYNSETLKPDSIYKLKLKNPIPLALFQVSSLDGTGKITRDSRYYLAGIFEKYDAKGNILQQRNANDIIESFIWGYGSQYPVAKILGSDYYSAISESGVNLAIVNNPFTPDHIMKSELDKLRTIKNAFVTTFTYLPMVGLTSLTDANNVSTTYEYDSFNRLRLVRDNFGKILKSFDYQYQKSY